MKQIIQSLSSGNIELIEVPIPQVGKDQILVKTSFSLISSGTERMLINFGKLNLIGKARSNPDKVKDVINKISVDGPLSAIDAVNNKLDQPISLGYCNVGEIVEIGSSISEYKIGDRVVSNGSHSEYVLVSKNLSAKIPEEVQDEDAVFVILASIGLQGIRLAKPSMGETFVVCGLGLIGLLTAQLLKANGCEVIGLDHNQERINIAKKLEINSYNSKNINDCISWCGDITNNKGVDGFLITSATNSNSPIDIASKICRKRGRIILIGTSGISINRNLFYEKELTFQVSCSYGPGRYDPIYEDKGIDYPIQYVRWTEKRNFEAVLQIIKSNKLNLNKLVTHKYEISEAKNAYKLLHEDPSALGIVFSYKTNKKNKENKERLINFADNVSSIDNNEKISASVIGAGNYASRVFIPSLSKNKINLKLIVSRNGLDSAILAKKFNFKQSGTNHNDIWNDNETNTVFVLSRHNSHAEYVINALNSGKHVFVEKPLCISEDQLNLIISAYKNSRKSDGSGPLLMVGFNRRFSSFTQKIKRELETINAPKAFTYTCNAGFIDKLNWNNDTEVGGGRLIGEACHFIDLIMYLSGSKIKNIDIVKAKDNKISPDTFSIIIKFENGSIGNVNYFANGNKKYPKEKLEIFTSGRIYQINNFINLKTWGAPNLKNIRRISQDKGQKACISEFISAIKNSMKSPIPFEEICDLHKFVFLANKKT